MSYILDALKKAESEREQGGVPGLHSQPMAPAPGDDDDDGARGRTQPIVWVGAGAALCLIAVMGWKLIARDDAEPSARMADAAPATHEMPAAPPVAPQPPAAQPQPPAAQPQPPMATHAPAVPPAPPARTETRPASPPMAPAPLAETTPQQRPVTANPSGNTAPQGGQRIPALHELPDDVRRDIPQVTVGGAMYSEIPSQRMLIINSQVFREGDQPYQGLVLEEIRLKSAVFKYRGYRYSINY